jgi:DinB superfamily
MTPQADLDLAFTLRQSCDTLRDSLHGISEEDARKCPAPGRWSALDCVEHLVIAEEAALKRLQSAQPLSEPVYQPEREVALAAVANRGDRVEAPLRALPTGRFASLEEALAHFSAARQRTIAFIETEPLCEVCRSHIHFSDPSQATNIRCWLRLTPCVTPRKFARFANN